MAGLSPHPDAASGAKAFWIAGVLVLLVSLGAGGMRVVGQEHGSLRPDLSGRWQLNRELSEDAQVKLERMRSVPGSGHAPPSHGFGGLFSGLFGGEHNAEMDKARELIRNAPPLLVVRQDGDRIVLTHSDGGTRTLNVNGRRDKTNGRDVQSNWDKNRLVSETALGNGKVTETYERLANAPQLIVTTTADLGRGHKVSVRRVYDARSPR